MRKKEAALFLYIPGFIMMVFLFSWNTTYASHAWVQGVNRTQSLSPETKQQLDALLKNYRVYAIDAGAVHAGILVSATASLQSTPPGLTLQLDLENVDLHLYPRDYTGNDFQFLVSYPEGMEELADIPVETYQGYVNGNPAQVAAFSVNAREFRGVFQNKGTNIYIEPLKSMSIHGIEENLYVYYDARDVISETRVCAVNEIQKAWKARNKNAVESVSAGCVGMRIALVADYAFYKGKGADAVEAALDMMHILNMVDALFYRSSTAATSPGGGYNLHFRVTAVYIAASPNEISLDSETYVYTMLTNFENWGNAGTKINPAAYDVATLFTKKNFSGNGGTGTFGLANVGGACSNKGYNIIKSDWIFFGDVLEAVDMAHEIGHNLNAAHTGGTDIMSPSITESNTTWGSSTPGTINAFISSHTSCIKACSVYVPEPDFTADMKTGCGGALLVNFINKTDFTDVATTYSWDFGDGQTSTQQHPSHTYGTAGSYGVSLAATNVNGSATETKKDFIWVGTAPHAAQTVPVTPQSGTPSYHSLAGPSSAVMQFKALDDIEFVSLKMQGNETGPRMLSLTTDSGRTILDQKIVTLPAQAMTTVNLNWRLVKDKTYQLVATRTGTLNGTQYYNNLYRTVGTALLPKTVSGLITVNGNHVTMGGSSGAADPTGVNYWYIGFEWQVRKLCSASVGVRDVEYDTDIRVYPNPGHGLYRLEGQAAGEILVEVYTVLGECIYRTGHVHLSSGYPEILDISEAPAGTYLLKIKDGNSQVTQKLIKLNE